MFPDLMVNGAQVSVEANFGFGINKDATNIRCISKLSYSQNESLLLTTEVHCIFDITEEGSKQLIEKGRVEVGFLRYLATITTGTARGIIHTKTENTVLNPIVLPPLNLVEVIKDGFIFASGVRQ